jgi:hypothetical protein
MAYAALGWAVFPLHTPKIGPSGDPKCSCGHGDCGSVGKHPRTVSGLKEATVDLDQIRRWWLQWPEANIGVATGTASNIIVLDVDDDKGGRESLAELMNEYGEIAETVEAHTGGGGSHIIFARNDLPIGNSASKLGPGLDVRGDGGYIVAAPSLHKSTKRYEWAERSSPWDCKPVVMPHWMVGKLLAKPAPKPIARVGVTSDTASHWLGKALAKAGVGSRNETGFWLAQQLRDARIPEHEAERVLCDYADRCPRGDSPYTHREAMNSVRSAYATAAREPATSNRGTGWRPERSRGIPQASPRDERAPIVSGAAAELKDYLRKIVNREIVNVPWSFPVMTRLTQALLPGSVTCIVGDPGVGKTFFILDEMRFWYGNDIPYAVFFIEKDRKFHTLRLLAQLEGNSQFVDFDWVASHGADVMNAMDRHAPMIDELGRDIYSEPEDRVTLQSLNGWILQMASAGKRIIVVDPITAVASPKDRWTEDEQFIIQAQKILTQHGASLVLTTHAKKGRRPSAPTLDDVALGAAYSRFCDTSMWLVNEKKPRAVKYQSPCGPLENKFTKFMQLHKTRNGRGGGQEIAFRFGDGLHYSEQGIVLEDVKKGRGIDVDDMASDDDGKDPFPSATSLHVPRVTTLDDL